MNLQENIERIKQMINFKDHKSLVSESKNIGIEKILGRKFNLDTSKEPYTFEIEDKNKNLIKMQIIAPTGNFINIVDVDHVIEELPDGSKKLLGYNFKGKSGTVKLIEPTDVRKIIEFVDNPDLKSKTISFVQFKKI